MNIRPATAADLDFIAGLTAQPGYAPFLTHEEPAGLATYLTNPSTQLCIHEAEGQHAGFALFAQLEEPSGAVELRRLGLAQAGGGRGLPFVRALTDYAFESFGANRVWLDASGENLRAARVYEQAGYKLEGTLRAHWWRPALGRTVDLLIFGILRSEWQASHKG